MYDFQRQHPISGVTKTIAAIRQNLISIIVVFLVGSGSESIPLVWLVYLGIPLVFISGMVGWWRFQYKVTENELHIKSGVFVRKSLVLEKDRVQVIDISSGILLRFFGLVKVDIQTAGSTSRAAVIDAVTVERAREINRLLRNNGENIDLDEAGSENTEERTIFNLPLKNLLIAATTSGRFGIILSIIATIFSQIQPAIEEVEIVEYITALLPSETNFVLILSIALLFIFVAWLLSFFSTVLMYGNFSVEVKEDELVVSRGIFEQKRITVPFHRIQAIYVNEGILRQPFGYASVHMESAGYGDDKGTGSFVLFPLIAKEKISELIYDVVPKYNIRLDGIKPPKRAIRRYILRSAFIITLVTALVFWLADIGNWIWILPAASIFWGWRIYKDTGVGWNEKAVLMSNRKISKSTSLIMKDRIQDFSISTSPIQRYRNLCTVKIYVASGDHGKLFHVRDIDLNDGELLLKDLQKSRKSFWTDENSNTISNRISEELPSWPGLESSSA